MSKEVICLSRARAMKNDRLQCVETFSGYRSSKRDPRGSQHLLPPDANDRDLGLAVLDALAHSRFVRPQDDPALFDNESTAERYEAWVKDLMFAYGYGVRSDLFKDMRSCNIESQNGTITIRPSVHDKPEGWSGDGIGEKDFVVISDERPAAEIGAALRQAFGRCK